MLFAIFSLFVVAYVLIVLYLALVRSTKRGAIAFLHPASGAGGGGERVLWVAIQHLLARDPAQEIVLYSSRFAPSPQEMHDDERCTDFLISTLVPRQFGIFISDEQQRRRLHVRYIALQDLQNPNIYPIARLLLQSLVGGAALALGVLAAEMQRCFGAAAAKERKDFIAELFIDSVGIPFSYPWIRLLFVRCRVGAYVHYPYISTDMIDSVASERAMPNNPNPAQGSKKSLKLLYYRIMVLAYRWLAGSRVLGVNGPVACNSTWTRNHIVRAWEPASPAQDVRLLFPPVNVAHLRQIPIDRSTVKGGNGNRPFFISVGQFRPEKNHPLLIRSFARAMRELRRERAGSGSGSGSGNNSDGLPRLIIIGGARNDEDKQRVEALKQLVQRNPDLQKVDGEDDVEFRVNASFPELESNMQRALVGLHTMRDEHFGIVVVEYMASGCICVAHRSAGPLEIVGTDGTAGFLCDTEEEYAETMIQIVRAWNKNKASFDSLREKGRAAASRFSDEAFAENFCKIFLDSA